jgi:hypothetical protein
MFPVVGGVPKETWRASAVADSEGRFQLTLGGPPRTEAVLVAHQDGWRPAVLRIDPAAIDWKQEVVLKLEKGAEIEGVVRLDGERVGGALVTADRAYGSPGLHSWAAELWWTDGAFEMKTGTVETDDRGAFTISGLAPATYELRVQRVLLGPFLDVGSTLQVPVSAPATGIALDIESGRIRIRVTGDAGPFAAEQLLVVSGRGGGMARRENCSSYEIAVATGVSYTVEAAHPGHEPKRVAVSPLTSGEVREVELRLLARAVRGLLLIPRRASPPGLSRVGVRLLPHQSSPESESTIVQVLRDRLNALRRDDGSFLVQDVPYPPGRYTLQLFPDSSSSFVLPSRAEVVLNIEGMTEARVDIALGGREWIEVRDSTGHDVSADYTLRDNSGVVVRNARMSGGMRMTSGGIGPGGARRPTERATETEAAVLAPGMYEAEVQSPGFRTVRRTISIKPGQVTQEEVRLERQ